MAAPAPAGAAAAEKPAAVAEDFIDILYAPADVFRRRERGNPWIPFLVVGLGLAVIAFFTFSAMQPIMEAEFARAAPQLLKRNPQLTQAQLDRGREIQEQFGRYFLFLVMPA